VSTINARLAINWRVITTGSRDLGAPTAPVDLDPLVVLKPGSGAGQAAKSWDDGARSIPASGSENLDLSGTLTNRFGETQAFTAIKALFIRAASTNVNDVIVGGAAANPWVAVLGATGTVRLRPGAVLPLMCGQADASGYAVVDATGDQLKVANSGAGSAVLYDILIVGI
jgi:hypothetical protein